MSLQLLSRSWYGLARNYLFSSCRCIAAKKETNTVPEPPKRPLSGYQLFTKAILPFLVKQHPDVKNATDRMKIAALKWNEAGSETKEKYVQLANKDRERYFKEQELFISTVSDDDLAAIRDAAARKRFSKQQRRFKTKLRELQKPRGARTAFNFFCLKMRTGKKPITESIKDMADSWRSLPEDEKEVFIKQAEADKRRYEEEMTDWEAKMEMSGHSDILAQLANKQTGRLAFLTHPRSTRPPSSKEERPT